ncbi:hypothetical protein R1sor_018366 [Riccia sorocarpa]|uniref:Protein kinase domain-containing protein n=1 Tax=Riccia sorocarpa TaxID=122646 RepID=A0ABD3IB59_9MARC
MDPRLRWLALVLLQVMFLPQGSCDEPFTFSCKNVETESGSLDFTVGECETKPAKDLTWNKTAQTLTVTGSSSVSITFYFNFTQLPSAPSPPSPPSLPSYAADPYGNDPRPPSKILIAKLNESKCEPSTYLSIDQTNSNSDEYTTEAHEFSYNTRLLMNETETTDCELYYFDVIISNPEKSSSKTPATPPSTSTEGPSDQNSNSKKGQKSQKGLVLGLAIGGPFCLLIILGALFVTRRRVPWRKLSPMNSTTSKDNDFTSMNDLSDLEVGAPRVYSYKELSSATHGFSPKYVVGEGGFGTVYKGVLKDVPCPLAIKRLSQYARQGAREFLAEVKIISQLRHRNLVQLLGWCLERDELILVYEYMPNGDLDDLIYSDNPKVELSWKQRYNILCGVATALVYLHEEWVQRVVHRDVKTSNVMLDSNLNARLGDFGLARLSAHSQAPQSTLVAGTLGYLAPEFTSSGKATDKTDVYSFGVVALEVTCAQRPLSPDLILVDWVWNHHKQETLLEAVDQRLDPKLRSTDDELQMKTVLQVGLLCCHPDPNARPGMRQVFNMLKGEASLPRVPRSKPVASYVEDD